LAVRAQFLELRRGAVLKWIAEAMEAAWLDVIGGMSMSELASFFSRRDALGQLAGRFILRLADVVAQEAAQLLSRIEVGVSVVDREAAGLGEAGFEVALTVLEPSVVFRDMASAAVAVALAGPRPYRAARPVELVPESVHSRVGTSLRVHLGAGAGPLPPAVADWLGWPDAELSVDLFLSAGSLATLMGREGIRSVERLSVGWQGFARSPRGLLPHTDADRNDRVDLFTATVRSLVGHRLLISEVMAAPDGKDDQLEFVEVYNPGFAEARLDGWTLRDASGRAYTMPPGTRIGPGQVLVVARSMAPFVGAYHRLPDVATMTVALNDDNDTLELRNAEGWVSDRVEWGRPWSGRLDAAPGMSIARRPAEVAPGALPGSALEWTGGLLDFESQRPSPGSLPPRA
jgi:hypothetical protein